MQPEKFFFWFLAFGYCVFQEIFILFFTNENQLVFYVKYHLFLNQCERFLLILEKTSSELILHNCIICYCLVIMTIHFCSVLAWSKGGALYLIFPVIIIVHGSIKCLPYHFVHSSFCFKSAFIHIFFRFLESHFIHGKCLIILKRSCD